MLGLLGYIPGTTVVHRLHPLVKLAIAFALSCACFLTQNALLVLLVAALTMGAAWLARALPQAVRIAKPLVRLALVFFVLQTLLIRDGARLVDLPPLLVVTDLGLSLSFLLAARMVAISLPLALLLLVTPVTDIANALTRSCGVPYKYAFTITTAIHFIPLFASEMSEIMEAQTARGVRFDAKSVVTKIRLMIPLCVPLLVSSVKKTEQCAISAELRGFQLRTRHSGYRLYPLHGIDAAALALAAALLALCILL